ncbi:nucleotidyltransferase domain-containing protein [Rhizobium rhizogenes]|uniref:anti-phage Hailong system nucleotidyltransferase HalB n=1 Tax=Rhizobium rhizogenes TaxID=359 RepID=UPI0022C1887B|nr:nucleotidyltransferase domain-containing protein [Rhizobium rhizogenes]MCZ7452319.1 nucleotidyltransferase domain-containing protein [Rhizobium rhizogenes]
MSIVAQYIFGSHARGDFNEGSDIDLLAVVDDDVFSSFSHGKLNVSFYPGDKLLEDARAGNLFVMHIVREAVLTYDRSNFHALVLQSFVERSNYRREIDNASDLGWFLLFQQAKFKNRDVVNRRISWCVRTILIALTAEEGTPAFAPHELIRYADKPYVASLLSLKSRSGITSVELDHLGTFLSQFGHAAPAAIVQEDLKKTWVRFRDTQNSIGIKTIAQMDIDIEGEFYS